MKVLLTHHRDVGFFSDFNLMVTGLLHLYKNNITEFNVRWNNWRYQNDNSNLFDTFFFELPTLVDFDKTLPVDALEEVKMWKPFMENHEIELLHNVLKTANYFNNNVYKHSLNIASQKVQSNFLGVHVRCTDAVLHRPALSLYEYFKAVDDLLSKHFFGGIFVATDDAFVVNHFISKYGENFISYNDNVVRSQDGTALHHNPNFNNNIKLAYDVLLDGVCLSLCDSLVHTASNVVGYSVMLNPQIKRTQIDLHLPHY